MKTLAFTIAINFFGILFNLCMQIVCITTSYKINANVQKTPYFYPRCLRALLGFERWQSANRGLPLGSVKDHQGSIGGVEASRIKVVLD